MKVLLEIDLTLRSANLRVLAEHCLSALVETELSWQAIFKLDVQGPAGPNERYSLLLL